MKAFCVEEDVVLLMVFLEQLGCLCCRFFGNARYMKLAASLQGQLNPRSRGHLSHNFYIRRNEFPRIGYDKAGIPPKQAGSLASAGTMESFEQQVNTRNSGNEWHICNQRCSAGRRI